MIIKSWTWLTIAGVTFVGLAVGLAWVTTMLIRGNRSDILVSLPMRPELEFELAAVGEVLLRIEVPRYTREFRKFQFELIEPNGKSTALSFNVITGSGTVTTGSTLKVPIGRFNATQAGQHRLRVVGLEAVGDTSAYRVMISRPYLARMIAQIVGIVFCGVGMLLCLLWALWLMGVLKQTGAAEIVESGKS